MGVTHECDYLPDVIGKPVLTASRIHGRSLTSAAIDHAVSMAGPRGPTALDEALLRVRQPDLVLTRSCVTRAGSRRHGGATGRPVPGCRDARGLFGATTSSAFDNIALVGQLTEREREKRRSGTV